MLERHRLPELDLLSLSPVPRPSCVLWAPKGLEWPQQQRLSSWEVLLPWDKAGNVSARKGCVPEGALRPARPAGPGVGQSLALQGDSEGQNPSHVRSQALGPAAGKVCPYGKGVSLPPSLPQAPGPELLQGLQSSLSSPQERRLLHLLLLAGSCVLTSCQVPCAGVTLLRGDSALG